MSVACRYHPPPPRKSAIGDWGVTQQPATGESRHPGGEPHDRNRQSAHCGRPTSSGGWWGSASQGIRGETPVILGSIRSTHSSPETGTANMEHGLCRDGGVLPFEQNSAGPRDLRLGEGWNSLLSASGSQSGRHYLMDPVLHTVCGSNGEVKT